MIRCRLQLLGAFISGRSGETHRRRCSLCRDELAVDTELEKRLRSENPASKSIDVSDAVMRRIRLDDEPLKHPLKEGSPVRFPLFPALAGAAALIAAAAFFGEPTKPEIPKGVAGAQAVQASPLPQPLLPEVPAITPEQIGKLTAKLNEPLQKELQFVISDTREAIQFVASNFLPENPPRR